MVISKRFCPKCKGDNVEMVAGGIMGIWACKDCGFSGTVFPEREIVGGNIQMKKGGRKK